jgi:lipopolysaccharide/colanic/teichoic acid biosynthesis glycosyltransferase
VLLLPLARRAALELVRGRPWWPEPVVLAGTTEGTVRIREVLQRMPELGFRPVGMLLAGPPEIGWGDSVLGTVADAPDIAARGIRVALVDRDVESREALDWLRRFFPRVVVLGDYADMPVEGVQVRNLGGMLGLEYGNNLLRPYARWVKRAVDLTVGGTALVLALPIVAFALVLVRLSGSGPLFYWQVREGRFGKPFRVPKIRTMVPDAERRLQEHFELNAALRAEWEASYKLRTDPRLIPGLGRWLRRFSIDELPQLWSVVKGEMSLVGPRPFPHYHLQAISARSLDLRRQVRPGITGMWQVVARGVADVQAQEAYDSHYIRNWSLWLDLYILGKTVAAVLSGRGAY